jgi:hypothetical protein
MDTERYAHGRVARLDWLLGSYEICDWQVIPAGLPRQVVLYILSSSPQMLGRHE